VDGAGLVDTGAIDLANRRLQPLGHLSVGAHMPEERLAWQGDRPPHALLVSMARNI
jgi:hypothetical protein